MTVTLNCYVCATATAHVPAEAIAPHPLAECFGHTCQGCGAWTPDLGPDGDGWDAALRTGRVPHHVVTGHPTGMIAWADSHAAARAGVPSWIRDAVRDEGSRILCRWDAEEGARS